MANIIFLEAGTDSTKDRLLFSAFSGSSASDATISHDGLCSLKCDSTGTNTAAYCDKSGILADAGRRVSFWLRFSALPATSPRVFSAMTSGAAATCVSLDVRSTGKLSIETSSTNFDGTTILSTNTWYRVTFSYTITSTTVNSFKVYLNGVLEISQTNITLGNIASNTMRIGMVQAFGASKQVWIDSIYVDDGTDLGDPGTTSGLSCTAKLYVGTSEDATNNAFDTFGGTNRSLGSHYLNVSERPDSDTNFWEQAGTTQVYEKYLIEAASAGDVDMSAGTLLGWVAWVRSKTSASSSVASIVDNDVDTAITTTTGINQFFHATTSGTYPSGRFGMRSTGTATDTFFYEGGVIVAYIPQRTQAVGVTSTATVTRPVMAAAKEADLTSTTTRARALQASKTPTAFAQSDTTRTVTRQATKSLVAGADSDFARKVIRQSGKIASASSSATLSYGPTALTRALTLTSIGILSRLAAVIHNLGPLHVDGILADLTRQGAKAPTATSSTTLGYGPTAIGRVPAASALSSSSAQKSVTPGPLVAAASALSNLLKLVAHLSLFATADGIKRFTKSVIPGAFAATTSGNAARSLLVSKLVSAVSSAVLDLILPAAHSYTQAVDAVSTVLAALVRSATNQAAATSTATPDRTLSGAHALNAANTAVPKIERLSAYLWQLAASAASAVASTRQASKLLNSDGLSTLATSKAVAFALNLVSIAQLVLQAGANTAQSINLAVTSAAAMILSRAVTHDGTSAASLGLATRLLSSTRALLAASSSALDLAALRVIMQNIYASATSLAASARAILAERTQAATGTMALPRAMSTARDITSIAGLTLSRAATRLIAAPATGLADLITARAAYLALSAASSATALGQNTVLWTRTASAASAASLRRSVGKLMSVVSDAILVLSTGATTTVSQLLAATGVGLGSLSRAMSFTRSLGSAASLSINKALAVARARVVSGLAVLNKQVGVSRASSAVSAAALAVSQVFSQIVSTISTTLASNARVVGLSLRSVSVSSMGIMRGVGKFVARLVSGLSGLVTRHLFRPGRPFWRSSGEVSIQPANTGDVTVGYNNTGDVSIKERDHADL